MDLMKNLTSQAILNFQLYGALENTSMNVYCSIDKDTVFVRRFRAHSTTPDKSLARLNLSYALIYENKLPIVLRKRERQVIGLMNQGLTSEEIVRELRLSHRTIEDVRARLLKRFGVKRSADLLGRLTEFG